MKTILILTAIFVITLLTGAHGYSKSKDDLLITKEPVVKSDNSADVKQEPKPIVKPVKVKNIWKDMPSYDRYGNEITARARMNMEQNRKLEKEEANKQNNNLAQEVK